MDFLASSVDLLASSVDLLASSVDLLASYYIIGLWTHWLASINSVKHSRFGG